MNLAVGWGATLVRGFPALREVAFEGRNPTTKNFGIVGFHFVLPNLHLFLSSQNDRRAITNQTVIGIKLPNSIYGGGKF